MQCHLMTSAIELGIDILHTDIRYLLSSSSDHPEILAKAIRRPLAD